MRLRDGYESDIERASYEKAQKLLKDQKCDLLISGRVKGHSRDRTAAVASLTLADAKDANPENYTLTETFDLPSDFIGDLGAAISAKVIMSAAPAVHMTAHYLVPLMHATAERLEPMLAHLSSAFDNDTRGSLYFNYGLVQAVIGTQAGSNEALSRSVKAFAPLCWNARASACRCDGP